MPTHMEIKVLPYTPQQMYDLVADIESYPKFLPWCAAARVQRVEEGPDRDVVEANLAVSFKVYRETFGSRVVLIKDERRIETDYVDGPLRHMHSTWKFLEHPEGVEVDFHVDFEFKSAILRSLVGLVFDDAMRRIVRAFERRAADVYG